VLSESLRTVSADPQEEGRRVEGDSFSGSPVSPSSLDLRIWREEAGNGRQTGMTEEQSTAEKKPLAAERKKRRIAPKKAPVPATVKLGKAAGVALKKNSKKIADSLADNSIKGNIQSARFLLELVEVSEKLEKDEGRRNNPSQALQLAEDPEWGSTQSAVNTEGACGEGAKEDLVP